jgi:hypothetical protein
MGLFKSHGALFHLLITARSIGQLNQAELSARIDSFLLTPTGDTEHLHNQLIAAIYGNVTREMPDQGVASWVSANDKPTTGAGSKPVSGDAAEQRLKIEVMQLPSRDRRRLKDLSQNDVSSAGPWLSTPPVPWIRLTNAPLSLIHSMHYQISLGKCAGRSPQEQRNLCPRVPVA